MGPVALLYQGCVFLEFGTAAPLTGVAEDYESTGAAGIMGACPEFSTGAPFTGPSVNYGFTDSDTRCAQGVLARGALSICSVNWPILATSDLESLRDPWLGRPARTPLP